jgi:hypothetical protein
LLPIAPTMSVLFETMDLASASPATSASAVLAALGSFSHPLLIHAYVSLFEFVPQFLDVAWCT